MVVTPGHEFDLSGAVNLFSQQAALVTNLWTVYVIATFATAGFAVSSGKPLSRYVLIGVTIGFWLFALGHLRLITQSLQIMQGLAGDINSFIINIPQNDPSFPFKSSVAELAKTANPPWISIVIHLVIDTCATVALWTGSKF